MNIIKFERKDCARIRGLLDAFLSNELMVETTQDVLEHLDGCPECAEILSCREEIQLRLRQAARNEAAPAELQARIQAALRADLAQRQPVGSGWAFVQQTWARFQQTWVRFQQTWFHGWQGTVVATAVVAVLAVGGVFAARSAGLLGSTPNTAPRSMGLDDGSALKVGFADHVHCALLRPLPQQTPSDDVVTAKLGKEFAGLYPIVQQQVPAGATFVDGHVCHMAERHFVHFIYRQNGMLVSIIATERGPGEVLERAQALEIVEASGVSLYRARVENIQVDGFEAGQFFVYVVSGLPSEQNLQLAQAIVRPVSDFLGQAAG